MLLSTAANVATGHATFTSEAAGGDLFYDVDGFFIYFLGGEVHSVSVMCRRFTEQVKTKTKTRKGMPRGGHDHDTTWYLALP